MRNNIIKKGFGFISGSFFISGGRTNFKNAKNNVALWRIIVYVSDKSVGLTRLMACICVFGYIGFSDASYQLFYESAKTV